MGGGVTRLATASATSGNSGKGDVHIHLGGVTLGNNMDIYDTAYRLAKRVRDGI